MSRFPSPPFGCALTSTPSCLHVLHPSADDGSRALGRKRQRKKERKNERDRADGETCMRLKETKLLLCRLLLNMAGIG